MAVLETEKAGVQKAEQGKRTLGHKAIRGFMQGAVLKGFDPEAILASAGLPTRWYHDPHARIDGYQLNALCNAIMEKMNDGYLGVLQEPTRPAMVDYLMMTSGKARTLHEYTTSMNRHRQAFRDDVRYGQVIDTDKNEYLWTIKCHFLPGIDERLFYWFRLMSNYKASCAMLGQRIKMRYVSFTCPPPGPDSSVDCYDVFNCEVRFNQAYNGLCYDRKCADMRIDFERTKIIGQGDFFEIPEPDHSLVSQVEAVVRSFQKEGVWSSTLAMVADELQMGTRTLRRHLARENENFLAIKARLRSERAIELLIKTDIPVTQIAEKIGYSDPGDFTRAFTSWTGETPSAYRKNHKG